MSCRVKWNRDFIITHFEKTYIANDYRIYRENILFEKEMGLLPMTQPYVEKQIDVERLEQDYRDMQNEQILLSRKMSQKRNEIIKITMSNDVERRKYVRKCPKNDCQGFLSANLKCEICNSWVCSECREIKGTTRDADHECNADILESVKLLAADTKSCPKCSSMIYKIEGCSQMFCTECHTAFDWNTLRIATGVIHNPHYFEWMRMQNPENGHVDRNPHEIQCGRELDHHFANALRQAFTKIYSKTAPTNLEFKNKILTMLYEKIKPLSITFYNKIIKDVNSSVELNRLFTRQNRFIYADTLVQFVYKLLLNHPPNRLEDDTNNSEKWNIFNEFLQTFRTFEVRQMDERIIKLENIIRNIIHIREVEMRRWTIHDLIQYNLDLRIQYMRNRLTADKFKLLIQKRDKESQRNIEVINILRMFISCITDLFYRIFDKVNTFAEEESTEDVQRKETLFAEIFVIKTEDNDEEKIHSLLDECHELRKYTNRCMKTVLVTYGSTIKPDINKEFNYMHLHG
jgi:hypothetical protein